MQLLIMPLLRGLRTEKVTDTWRHISCPLFRTFHASATISRVSMHRLQLGLPGTQHYIIYFPTGLYFLIGICFPACMWRTQEQTMNPEIDARACTACSIYAVCPVYTSATAVRTHQTPIQVKSALNCSQSTTVVHSAEIGNLKSGEM